MAQSKVLASQALTVISIIILSVWGATQWTAEALGYQTRLGAPWFTLADYPFYKPWRLFQWWYAYGPYTPEIFDTGGSIAAGGAGLAVIVAVILSIWRARIQKNVTTFGSARWAEKADLGKSGLLNSEGVFLGKWKGSYLRHHGPEHIMAFAPTRSGKGVGLVVPTLLSWTGSAIIHDIKGENWDLTAHWRSKFSHCLLFDPTNPKSAKYNPLLEVRKGEYEVRDVQNIADILVDPDGSLERRNHWEKTGHALLVGVILHVLYAEEDKTLSGCAAFLSDPKRTFKSTLSHMMRTKHIGEGASARPHPVVAQAARELFNKSDNERSGVLSTAMSFLGLYRDPVVANVTSKSDWRIADFIDGKHPCSLYLVVPPSDISRTKPLVRLILNQIGRRLTEQMPESGKPREVLLMLDEFPALGRLDFFESALAFMAGYGIRAYLIAQSLNQIEKAYGPNNSILDNCHVRVTFATNDERTAKRISDALGTKTEQRAQKNYSGHRLAPWLTNVMLSTQETARPLLTPGEVMQLPPNDEVVMVAGVPPIRGKKLRYYKDRNFTSRLGDVPADLILPVARKHDWPYTTRPMASGAAGDDGAAVFEDDGGREVLLDPERQQPTPEPDREADDFMIALVDDDFGDDAQKKQLKQLRDAATLDLADDDVIGGF